MSDPTQEHLATRRSAGLFDLSDRGRLEVVGPDRVSWLHNLLTNDLKTLTPGHGCEAAFLTPHAKVRAIFFVYALPESLLLDCEGSLTASLSAALLKYRISERVEIRDRTSEFGLLSLQGPQAPAILAAWAGADAVPARELDHAARAVRDLPIVIIHNSLIGDAGFHLLMPAASQPAVREQVLAVGGPMGLTPCGVEAWESLRIEAGLPRYGRDITEEILLPEAGLDRAVSTTKGCYLGQEFVVRIRDRGQVTRRLSLLALEGTTAAPAGAVIRAGDPSTPRLRSGQASLGTSRVVGAVTSSAFVPTQGRALALGYLHRDAAQPGIALTIVLPTGPCPAVVTTPRISPGEGIS